MRTRSLTVAAATAAALATVAVTAPPAVSEGNISVDVQDVVARVSRTGGLTVSGTMNCADAVASSEQTLPANNQVLVNVDWTAWQATGRTKMVTATWQSDHADSCYDSDHPTVFLPWNTSHYNSSSTDFYVFASNGKFVKGPVHIDVRVAGGYDESGNPSPNVIGEGGEGLSVGVFGVTGFDVRATR